MSDSIEQLGPVTGHKGDVTVTLTNFSFRQTGKGRRYPYGEFGQDFIGALHKALPAPRRRGLIRWTLVCPSCESPLQGNPLKPVKVTASVALKRIPPIQVDLEMPGITCPRCARSFVTIDDRDVASDVSDALIDAFNGAAISPG